MVPASRPLYQQPLAISLGSAFIAITLTTVTTFLVRSPLRSGLFASFATIFIIQFLTPKGKPRYLKSPAATLLPQLSSSEIEALPLPLDALPGGRFVESPYGTTRVYEWGPENGRKVLLIHGITTPCIALGAIAHLLVKAGCRVMLFDEWGRGYSDAPTGVPYDDRLYTTQILHATTSSELSWTRFSVIGYSLGGGISICFTSYFKDMVESLILLAPAGLVRPSRLGFQRFLPKIFPYIPEGVLDRGLRRRLQKPMYPRENKGKVDEVVTSEVTTNEPELAITPASLKYPEKTVLAATQWNIAQHLGFVHSFVSVVQYGPGGNLEKDWKRLAAQERRILILMASEDPIIVPYELQPDIEQVIQGSGTSIEWKTVEGAAHDFTSTDPEKLVEWISEFWKRM